MNIICYIKSWFRALAIDKNECLGLTPQQREQETVQLSEQSAQEVADALGISLEQLTRRPTPRDLRGGKMAHLAQQAGQEAAHRK